MKCPHGKLIGSGDVCYKCAAEGTPVAFSPSSAAFAAPVLEPPPVRPQFTTSQNNLSGGELTLPGFLEIAKPLEALSGGERVRVIRALCVWFQIEVGQ